MLSRHVAKEGTMSTLTSEAINTSVKLDFEQRARAVRLEAHVSNDEYATAAEIIYLRDELARVTAGQPPPLTPMQKREAVQAMYADLVGGCVND
jgi:hypothetical protein